jgi:DNA-binding response OmpR family regulator
MKIDTRRRQKTVMCVDDDQTIREIVSDGLGSAGYQVVVCRTGEDCLSQLSRIEPQIILLDIEMPQLDGFTTLEMIRRRYPALSARIVMLTASRTEDAVHEARHLGADDYFIKPFRIDRLIDRVDFWTGLRT